MLVSAAKFCLLMIACKAEVAGMFLLVETDNLHSRANMSRQDTCILAMG